MKKQKGIMNKKAIEFAFSWIFAFIAGAFILLLAIYATSKFVGTQENVLYTETAARIVSLLDPYETGLGSGKSADINFKVDSAIYNEGCSSSENKPFGKQFISFSEKTFGNEYSKKGNKIAIYNKYVFMEDSSEGKSFIMFSKPFFMPFKVSDIIVLLSRDYCFYDVPDEIIRDLGPPPGLDIKLVHFPNSTQKCDGVKVCFASGKDCDIKVSIAEKYVEKNNKKMYFYDSLIYGAIFSSPEAYECNVKRLINKINELGLVYIDKIKIIERKQCQSNVESKLMTLMNNAKQISYSRDLTVLGELSDEINSINDAANPGCKLFN